MNLCVLLKIQIIACENEDVSLRIKDLIGSELFAVLATPGEGQPYT